MRSTRKWRGGSTRVRRHRGGFGGLVSGFPVWPVALRLAERTKDWLRERLYFEGLTKREEYIVKRLGYKAPNIFVMNVIS
jgi:hypothetical protein